MPTLNPASIVRAIYLANTPPTLPRFDVAPATVLITGSNTGLGLAAAQHFANLGTRTLILAVRTPSSGHAAAAQIAASTPYPVTCKVLQVDFADSLSIQAFVTKVDEGTRTGKWPPIDAVILNAGVISKGWAREDGKAERTIQINVLGNLLAAILLLPVLSRRQSFYSERRDSNESSSTDSFAEESAPQRATFKVPHIVLVSSMLYTTVQLSSLPPASQPILPALSAAPTPDNPFVTQAQYARSKLLIQIGAVRLAALIPLSQYSHQGLGPVSKGTTGALPLQPAVLLTTCCPGPCRSDLTRDFANASLMLKIAISSYALIMQRTAEQGSRTLVSAVAAASGSTGVGLAGNNEDGDGEVDEVKWKQENQGRWKQGGYWRNDVFEEPDGILATEEGTHWGDRVWDEIVESLAEEVPEVREIMEGIVEGSLA